MAVHFPFDITEWLFIIPPFFSGGDPMTTSSFSYRPPDLRGRVALVAGATRGVGRGIALALGEAGATGYFSGRRSRAEEKRFAKRRPAKVNHQALPGDYYAYRPETLQETAEMVTARGGTGIAAVVNHLKA